MRFRQVHLDFHTSPLIPGIGEKFDNKQWQDTLKEAAVDSITCFSCCHHGYSYHPTKVGKMHPHLKFNLLRCHLLLTFLCRLLQTESTGTLIRAEHGRHLRCNKLLSAYRAELCKLESLSSELLIVIFGPLTGFVYLGNLIAFILETFHLSAITLL